MSSTGRSNYGRRLLQQATRPSGVCDGTLPKQKRHLLNRVRRGGSSRFRTSNTLYLHKVYSGVDSRKQEKEGKQVKAHYNRDVTYHKGFPRKKKSSYCSLCCAQVQFRSAQIPHISPVKMSTSCQSGLEVTTTAVIWNINRSSFHRVYNDEKVERRHETAEVPRLAPIN